MMNAVAHYRRFGARAKMADGCRPEFGCQSSDKAAISRSSPQATTWRPHFLHGSDRVPIDASGRAVDPEAHYRAFLGTPSLGLVRHPSFAALASAWPAVGWRIDAALEGESELRTGIDRALMDACHDAGVLTFRESAAVAERFVLSDLSQCLAAIGHEQVARQGGEVDLWNVKEGHTSAVWQASVAPMAGGPRIALAINVARDRVAGEDLACSALILSVLAQVLPRRDVAAVLTSKAVEGGGSRAESVQVLAQRWIDGGAELGLVRERVSGRQTLVAIECFVTSSAQPGLITGVRGHPLRGAERDTVLADLLRLVRSARRATVDAGFQASRFSLDHGDFVLQGGVPRIVACDGIDVAQDVRADESGLLMGSILGPAVLDEEMATAFQAAETAVLAGDDRPRSYRQNMMAGAGPQ